MKPVSQKFKHQPELGIYGDCTRACIASLLELPLEEVPHLGGDKAAAECGELFWNRYECWLRGRGYTALSLAFEMDPADLLHMMGVMNKTLYWMMGCASPVADHHVVCLGGQVVHDPAGHAPERLKRDSLGYSWVTIITTRLFQSELGI